MPISRTHVNALADDDGSGTVGTPWNKARVTEVFDDIDAYVGPSGLWTAVTYAGGNFTGNVAMTWTVEAGDQTTFKYQRFEKTLRVKFALEATTVGGTLNTDLNILLPLGLIASGAVVGTFYYIDNATHGVGQMRVNNAGTVIRLLKVGFANWSASTNLTSVYGLADIETTT